MKRFLNMKVPLTHGVGVDLYLNIEFFHREEK